MNYFKVHIGDYEKKTAHLTACEDGMYCRLMRRYYDTEAPLPLDIGMIQRVVRAHSKEEKQAVKTVLAEFFTQADDGYHNSRCDEELAKYKNSEVNAAAKKEAEKIRKDRYNARRKEIFEVLREHNVVPNWDAPISELEHILSNIARNINASGDAELTHLERVPERGMDASRTVSGTAIATNPLIHKSNTSNKHTETLIRESAENPPPVCVSEPAKVCMALKEAGIGKVNPGNLDLIALLQAGATVGEFVDAASDAIPQGKGTFQYVIGTVKGRRRQAAETSKLTTAPQPKNRGKNDRSATYASLTGRARLPAEKSIDSVAVRVD